MCDDGCSELVRFTVPTCSMHATEASHQNQQPHAHGHTISEIQPRSRLNCAHVHCSGTICTEEFLQKSGRILHGRAPRDICVGNRHRATVSRDTETMKSSQGRHAMLCAVANLRRRARCAYSSFLASRIALGFRISQDPIRGHESCSSMCVRCRQTHQKDLVRVHSQRWVSEE